MKPSFPLSRWLMRVALALILAWVLVLGGWAFIHTSALLHPICATSLLQPAGYEPFSLAVEGNLTLKGWYRPSQNSAVILLLGGHGGSRDSMLPEAEILARAGYGILALEQRACAGALATLGYREGQDVQKLAVFAAGLPGVRWVGALGFSAGGVAVIRAAAREGLIRAVAAEGNYANLLDELSPAPGSPNAWLEWQIHPLVMGYYTLWTGVLPSAVDPEGDLPAIIPRSVWLIHGELEIARSRGERQFERAGQPRALWVVPGAGHGGYLQAQPEEYARRLVEFFDLARQP